jgi:hypothetical protein
LNGVKAGHRSERLVWADSPPKAPSISSSNCRATGMRTARRDLTTERRLEGVRWRRTAFRGCRRWKSRCSDRKPGRPRIASEIRALVRKMKQANCGWGAPRIQGEPLTLGIEIGERTISRLPSRPSKPPLQTWPSFLDHHAADLVSLDFFTVQPLGLLVLFVLIVV